MVDRDEELQQPAVSDPLLSFGQRQNDEPSTAAIGSCGVDVYMPDDFALPELAGDSWDPSLFHGISTSDFNPISLPTDTTVAGHGLPAPNDAPTGSVKNLINAGRESLFPANEVDRDFTRSISQSQSDERFNNTRGFNEGQFLEGEFYAEWNDHSEHSDTARLAIPEIYPKAGRQRDRFDENQTLVLQSWLSENQSNPFPDASTKAHLNNLTGLSVRQIERWFARTRQRKLQRNLTAGTLINIRLKDETQTANMSKSEILVTQEIGSVKTPLKSHTTGQHQQTCRNFGPSRSRRQVQLPRRSESASAGRAINIKSNGACLRSQSCPPCTAFSLNYFHEFRSSLSASDTGASLQVAVASSPHGSSLPGALPQELLDNTKSTLFAAILEQNQTCSDDNLKVEVWLQSLPESIEPPYFPSTSEYLVEAYHSSSAPQHASQQSPSLPVAPKPRRDISCNSCRKRKIPCSGYDRSSDRRCGNCYLNNRRCLFRIILTQLVPVGQYPAIGPAAKDDEGDEQEPTSCGSQRQQLGHARSREQAAPNYLSRVSTAQYPPYPYIPGYDQLEYEAQDGSPTFHHAQTPYTPVQTDKRVGLKRRFSSYATVPQYAGDTRTGRAMSTGSGASCSSYMGFGPRKGRRVAYDSPSGSIRGAADLPTTLEETNALAMFGQVYDPHNIFESGGRSANAEHSGGGNQTPSHTLPQPPYPHGLTTDIADSLTTRQLPEGQLSKDLDGTMNHYKCTFCGNPYRTKYLWQRHEEATHVPPRVWICEPLTYNYLQTTQSSVSCPICDEEAVASVGEKSCSHGFLACWGKPEHERTFYQKEKLVQHLMGPHAAGSWARSCVILEHTVTVPDEALLCPFCEEELRDWDERVRHIACHFDKNEVLPKLVQLVPRGIQRGE